MDLIFVPDKIEFENFYYNLIKENRSDPFIGVKFPEVIENFKLSQFPVSRPMEITHHCIIKNISNERSVIMQLNNLFNSFDYKGRSALLLVDGLSPEIKKFLDTLYSMSGSSLKLIGGGAGSLSLKQDLCMFDNSGIYSDCALLAFLKTDLDVQINHGWKPINNNLLANETSKNKILEINWQPAFESYKDLLQTQNVILTRENFFEIAQNYPLGLFKSNSEFLIRDPVSVTEEGHIICLGDIPLNSTLSLMNGKINSLILAAKKVNEKITLNKSYNNLLVFDCISRFLFLKDDFNRELIALKGSNCSSINSFGALTLGEIASNNDLLEMHNKTIVASGVD